MFRVNKLIYQRVSSTIPWFYVEALSTPILSPHVFLFIFSTPKTFRRFSQCHGSQLPGAPPPARSKLKELGTSTRTLAWSAWRGNHSTNRGEVKVPMSGGCSHPYFYNIYMYINIHIYIYKYKYVSVSENEIINNSSLFIYIVIHI